MHHPNVVRHSFSAIALLCAGCASNAQLTHSPQDPYERFNRGVYRFNDAIDRGVAKPVAKAYRAVTPAPVRTGVGNFIANLETPMTMINDALQGKFKAALSDLGRFVLNTTMGIGGLFDVASKAGIERNDEDFGQTLGKWGVPSGPFVMLPLLGPSTVRDAPSRAVDAFSNPAAYANSEARWSYLGLSTVHKRYDLLSLDPTLDKAFDRYAFIRDAYLQNRQYKVTDGNVPEDELVDPDAPASPTDAAPAAPAKEPDKN